MFTIIAAYIVSIFTIDDNPVRPELVSPLVRRFIPKEKKLVIEDVEYKVVNRTVEIVPNEKV